jgi:methanogenic corrinoid protein MtbC1
MSQEVVIEQFFEALTAGDRPTARAIVHNQAGEGVDAESLIADLFWPTFEMIERLHRADHLSQLSYQLATRLLRSLADQVAAALPLTGHGPGAGRKILAVCGPEENNELGAQMAVDLLEAAAFEVLFTGGGIANDEILGQIHQEQPAIFLAFCSSPKDLPGIRVLIDHLHEIGACPDIQIALGGGVFNRAEGLAEEMGADIWAEDPIEMVHALIHDAEHRADAARRNLGRRRRSSRSAA